MARVGVGLFVALGLAAGGSIYDLSADDLQSGLPVPMSYYRGKVLLVVNLASKCGYTDATYAYLNSLHDAYAERGLAVLGFPCNQFGGQEPGGPDEVFAFATKTKRVKWDVRRRARARTAPPRAAPRRPRARAPPHERRAPPQLFRKIDVNGPAAHPLYKHLRGDAGSDCTDGDGSCASWAASGECANNKAFMEATCKLSCRLCDAPAGQQPPIGWNFEAFLVGKGGAVLERWPAGTVLTAAAQTAAIEAALAAKDEM